MDEKIEQFLKKDTRIFPELHISFLARTRPSGKVFLTRRSKKFGPIAYFNSVSELVTIVKTVCRKYKQREDE